MAKARTAKQAAASRANGKQHKGIGQRKPTAKQITKWKNTTRKVQSPVGLRRIVNEPVMRSGSKVVAYFPHRPPVKYLDTKTQNILVKFMKDNQFPEHNARIERYQIRKYLEARNKPRKVSKRPIKRLVK